MGEADYESRILSHLHQTHTLRLVFMPSHLVAAKWGTTLPPQKNHYKTIMIAGCLSRIRARQVNANTRCQNILTGNTVGAYR
jgi:hypothetical protein